MIWLYYGLFVIGAIGFLAAIVGFTAAILTLARLNRSRRGPR